MTTGSSTAAGADSRALEPAAIRRIGVAVGQWLDRYARPGQLITVACSGGADSTALAVATLAEATRQRYRVAAATVDHGLQDGSAQRALDIAAMLARLGYQQVHVLPVAVTGAGGTEAAARRARYDALFRIAAGGVVLLGHTLDDQAETVLLGLGRGSGPRSIAGMAASTPPYGRPLLGLRRADTEAACAAAGVEPWRDPHNSDPAYVRVRLRHEVLPLLETVLGGGVAPALARTATQLQEDGEVLDLLAADVLRRALSGTDLTVEVLAREPAALRRRALRTWLLAGGITALTADHLVRLDRLVTAPAATSAVRLPGAIDAVVRDGRLRFQPIG